MRRLQAGDRDPGLQATTVVRLGQTHGLATGTPVVYTAASPVSGLTSGTTYYVIAVDPSTDTVVFVEVKTRTGDGFGGLEQAVTPQKARRLRRLAGIWLAAQDQRWTAVRLDVVGVRIGRRRTPEITHLRGIG